jgi:hypothetical protein
VLVQGDVSVLNHILQHGGRLVHRVGKMKHYAQSMKKIGLGLGGRISGAAAQPRSQRNRIFNGRLNLMHPPRRYERSIAVLRKQQSKRVCTGYPDAHKCRTVAPSPGVLGQGPAGPDSGPAW